jgi:hypothetical protein
VASVAAFAPAPFRGGLFSLTLFFPTEAFLAFVAAGLQTGACFFFFFHVAQNKTASNTIPRTPGQLKIRYTALIFGIASNVPACYPALDAALPTNPRFIRLPRAQSEGLPRGLFRTVTNKLNL